MTKLIKWFLDLFKRKRSLRVWIQLSENLCYHDWLQGLTIYADNEKLDCVDLLKVDHKRGRIKVRLNKV